MNICKKTEKALEPMAREISPDCRRSLSFWATCFGLVENIIEYRRLIIQLFKRDFLMGYKKSFLGTTWVILSPLLGMASWIIMQTAGILQTGTTGVPYPIYLWVGTSLWGLFMGIFSSTSGFLNSGSSLILQISFPHEVLLAKEICQILANHLVTLAITAVLLVAAGISPGWRILLWPVLILPLFFWGVSLGLMASLVSTVVPDVGRFANGALGLLFFVTPVIYTKDVPHSTLRSLMEMNPLTYVFQFCRDFLFYGKTELWLAYLILLMFSVVIFFCVWRLFFVLEIRVLEKLQ